MSDTPARMTRARSRAQTPLPAIPARQSLAYGAQGRTEIRGQVTAPGTSLAAAFDRTRRATPAVETEDDEDEDAVSVSRTTTSVARKARGAKRNTAATAAFPEREGTGAAGEPAIEQGNNGDATQRTETIVGDAAYIDPRQAEPYTATILRYALRLAPTEILHDAFVRLPVFIWGTLTFGNIKWFLKNFFLFGFIFWLGVYMTLPASADWYRTQTWWRFSQVSRAIWDLPIFDVPLFQEQWMQLRYINVTDKMLPHHNMPERQWAFNSFFLSRLEDLERKIRELQGKVKLHDDTFAVLDNILPGQVAMRERVDSMDIPGDFWTALADRMSDNVGHPIWDAFVAANQERVATLSEEGVNRAIENGQVVDKATFAAMLSENNDWLREQYAEEFRSMEQRNLKEAKKLALSETTALIENSGSFSLAQKQLETLVNANELHNLRAAMRSVNYFSPGNGAVVVPFLTSPTINANDAWLQRLYRKIVTTLPTPNPPMIALLPWTEGTQCWCASPAKDSRGNAQITVRAGRKMYPEQVVIEHVPAQGTLNIAAAPRNLEFWAQAPSVEQAEALKALISSDLPAIDEYQCVGEAPASDFVCIGKGKYNIHGNNWVQSYPMFVDMQALGFGTEIVAIKAVTNWGTDATCFYRVRLVGDRLL